MAITQGELILALEALVDANGLYDVTSALELLCYEKAEHVQSSWQDKEATKRWNNAGKVFRTAYVRLEKIQLP